MAKKVTLKVKSKIELKKNPSESEGLLAIKWQLPPEYQNGKQCTRP